MKRRRRRHSAAEYFVAGLGMLILVMLAAMLACPGGCTVQLSPQLGVTPSEPTPSHRPAP